MEYLYYRDSLGPSTQRNARPNGLTEVSAASAIHKLRRARGLPKLSTVIRTIVARVERGFAAFAEIPYQDALARQELSQLLNEFEAECHAQSEAHQILSSRNRREIGATISVLTAAHRADG
jgi:hypothetical protein